MPQHLNSLAYYGEYLRNILHSVFVEHKFEIPMWDMHIGYGSDILTTLHYYVIGDPLTLLSVFVSPEKTEYLYAFLIFLRIYLAGIAFSRYCFYHRNSKQAVLLGSLIYIFAGWTIYAAMKHPYFANPMIYLPLILLGIDKIYRKEKPMYLSGLWRWQEYRISTSFICLEFLWCSMLPLTTLLCLQISRKEPSDALESGWQSSQVIL